MSQPQAKMMEKKLVDSFDINYEDAYRLLDGSYQPKPFPARCCVIENEDQDIRLAYYLLHPEGYSIRLKEIDGSTKRQALIFKDVP